MQGPFKFRTRAIPECPGKPPDHLLKGPFFTEHKWLLITSIPKVLLFMEINLLIDNSSSNKNSSWFIVAAGSRFLKKVWSTKKKWIPKVTWLYYKDVNRMSLLSINLTINFLLGLPRCFFYCCCWRQNSR